MRSTTPEVRRLIVKARKMGWKTKEITEIFDVSRGTVWRWTKRAHHRGRESYKNKSKRPHTIHRKITWEVENAIIVLRDSFNWGTQRIRVISSGNSFRDYLETPHVERTKHQYCSHETP